MGATKILLPGVKTMPESIKQGEALTITAADGGYIVSPTTFIVDNRNKVFTDVRELAKWLVQHFDPIGLAGDGWREPGSLPTAADFMKVQKESQCLCDEIQAMTPDQREKLGRQLDQMQREGRIPDGGAPYEFQAPGLTD